MDSLATAHDGWFGADVETDGTPRAMLAYLDTRLSEKISGVDSTTSRDSEWATRPRFFWWAAGAAGGQTTMIDSTSGQRMAQRTSRELTHLVATACNSVQLEPISHALVNYTPSHRFAAICNAMQRRAVGGSVRLIIPCSGVRISPGLQVGPGRTSRRSRDNGCSICYGAAVLDPSVRLLQPEDRNSSIRHADDPS